VHVTYGVMDSKHVHYEFEINMLDISGRLHWLALWACILIALRSSSIAFPIDEYPFELLV